MKLIDIHYYLSKKDRPKQYCFMPGRIHVQYVKLQKELLFYKFSIYPKYSNFHKYFSGDKIIL